MSDEEWGPWIEHDGGAMPVDGLFMTQVKFRDPRYRSTVRMARDWYWSWGWAGLPTYPYDIVAYRIRKPRGLTILESLLIDLPERVDA